MFKIEHIAEIAHEVNRAYCQANGDNSQPAWKDAPDWQKKSAVNGVEFVLNNPDLTPEQSHENWLKQKIADGWQWGEKKDPEKKTHPSMMPYDKLPLTERTKDYLFKGTVKVVAQLHLGLQQAFIDITEKSKEEITSWEKKFHDLKDQLKEDLKNAITSENNIDPKDMPSEDSNQGDAIKQQPADAPNDKDLGSIAESLKSSLQNTTKKDVPKQDASEKKS